MTSLFAWLSGSRIGRALVAVGAVLGAILAAWSIGRREGRRGAAADALRRAEKRRERGRDAQTEEMASDDDPAAVVRRMRDRDAEW